MEDNNKYKDLFLEESDEYLQVLNDGILKLEGNLNDSNALGDVFRAAHTLKGMAASMGYEDMAKLTHHMESVLELFKVDSTRLEADVITAIFNCLDKLSLMVDDLRDSEVTNVKIDDLVDTLNAIHKKHTNKKAADNSSKNKYDNASSMSVIMNDSGNIKVMKEALKKDMNIYFLEIKISEGSMLKAARAYLVINKLEQQGDIVHCEPSAELIESGDFDKSFELLFLSMLSEESVRDILGSISELEEIKITKVSPESVESMTNDPAPNDASKTKHDSEDTHEEDKIVAATNSIKLGHSIRVDVDRLDAFMNLVSELVIYRNQLQDATNNMHVEKNNEALVNVSRISTELQDLVLRIRMQPVSIAFNRFPRMVRDLSLELEKEIDFVVDGEDTELDRTVVTEIGEPLIHLIRNAVDHGIESPEERIGLGKPSRGRINLSASQEGNQVVINVSDDGKGINPSVIRDAAIKKGITVDGLSDADVQQLIFAPGFSTAKELTNVSGRGVGMDVVRQKILALGGNIRVISDIGEGTTFSIRLPLTLSIIQSLMISVSKETFAIPLSLIEKVIKIPSDEIHDTLNGEVYLYQEKAIPILRLRSVLNLKDEGSSGHLVIVHVEDKYYGLVVDDLLGQQEIVIKKISSIMGEAQEYLGATILGNGEVALILDVANICRQSQYSGNGGV